MKLIFLALFVSFQAVANIAITQGEKPVLTVNLKNSGQPFNLTGASIKTYFLKTDGTTELEVGSSDHTITNASGGVFTVDLVNSDTSTIKSGYHKTFKVLVTIGGRNYVFWGRKKLTVFPSAIKDQP